MKNIIFDLLDFLKVDINSDGNFRKVPRDEMYADREGYSEIIGMKRKGIDIFQRLLETNRFRSIQNGGKIKHPRRSYI